jgi:hypothetical protein
MEEVLTAARKHSVTDPKALALISMAFALGATVGILAVSQDHKMACDLMLKDLRTLIDEQKGKLKNEGLEKD